ncbi:hypothetical protein Tco_0252949 [Tanacetum coccineum]
MKQKLENLTILALDISGKNYLSWRLEAETYLDAHGLGDTIQARKVTTSMQKAKAWMFLRHHLHVDLKTEYLIVKAPLTRLTGVAPLLKANMATYNDYSGGCGRGYYRGRCYGRGQGQGRGFGRGNYYSVNHDVQFKNTSGHKKWQDMEKNENDVSRYQKYIKIEKIRVESNFVYDDRDDIPDDHKEQTDATHLDDDDFLTNE